jgi:cytochrome b subunit of formate dehydrogenase
MNPETPSQPIQNPKKESSDTPRIGTFSAIKHVTAWVMIISAILFAVIGVLAIWEVFGQDAGDVIWRAFSSMAIIAFAAFIVNIASRVSEAKH